MIAVFKIFVTLINILSLLLYDMGDFNLIYWINIAETAL